MAKKPKRAKPEKADAPKQLPDSAPSPKMGRPPKYRPEFCAMLVEHMASGLSFESFAAVADVDRDTIYEWAKTYPDFSDAKKRGSAKSQLIWEQEGITGMKMMGFNSAIWIFNMKNRFGWKDQPESDNSSLKPIPLAYVPKSRRELKP